MGADVYLESIHNKTRKEWHPKFDAAVKARNAYCAARGYVGGEVPAKDGIDPQYDRLQQAVSEAYSGMYGAGYFRDCYNGYGLFANLCDAEGNRPSWWQDVVPMLNDDGYLPIEQAAELRHRVVTAKIDLSSAREVATKQKDDPPELAVYESWRKELIDILDQSLALGEPLSMSL